MIVEVCCENIESAIIANNNGADRIELCSSLATGGLTPTPASIKALKNLLDIPIMVLIRARAGHFIYTDLEKKLMLKEIEQSLHAGADGIVMGALNEKFEIDETFIIEAMTICKNLSTTFHRAFDFIYDKQVAIANLIDLGFDRLLTSGGEQTAFKGIENLKKIINWAGNKISIMAGAGINSENIKALIENLSINEIHLSAKKLISKTDDSSPFTIDHFVTDEIELQKVKSIINDLL